MIEPVTARLRLRRWRESDREPFAALNADPEVMEHFAAPLSRAESDALAGSIAAAIERDGWGLWAVDERASGRFVGFVGLAVPGFEAPFGDAVEIGWRLARWSWGRGYATEAAGAALDAAFGPLGLDEVVSFTYEGNRRSRAVMERLGMARDPTDDFDHPLLPGHRIERHVLYRLRAADWRGSGGGHR
jgi:RimJ/RimL family protein N-acetyltransferase